VLALTRNASETRSAFDLDLQRICQQLWPLFSASVKDERNRGRGDTCQALWTHARLQLHRDIDNDDRTNERPLRGGVIKVLICGLKSRIKLRVIGWRRVSGVD
jgi:hypothetical protein